MNLYEKYDWMFLNEDPSEGPGADPDNPFDILNYINRNR